MAEISVSGFIQTDGHTDVLTSLFACLVCLRHCDDDPGLWKWAILSLHNAFQRAMVCHLSGTAQLGALTEESAREWLEWHERDRKGEIRRIDCGTDVLGTPRFRFAEGSGPPPERLADARELFRRLGNEKKRIERGVGTEISITPSERASFHRLNGLRRNNFTHFTSKGWSIELGMLPDAFLDVLGLIAKISANPWFFRHMSEEDKARLTDLIDQIRVELTAEKQRQH